MPEQSREILPVAVIDLERRIQNEEEILAAIAQSLDNPDGLSDSSRLELQREHKNVENFISKLALELVFRFENVA